MNWRQTWILVGIAMALFAFIMLFERRLTPTGTPPPPLQLFAKFKPTDARSVTLRRGNQFALTLDHTNGTWRFSKPFLYPAADFAVESFLRQLEQVVPATHISLREIQARKQTLANFGFDTPLIVIALERGDERQEIRFGSRTPAGDQVYVEVVGEPGLSVIGADILERLPRTQHDWRDTTLFHFGDQKVERAEITRAGAGFALALDPTNKLWRLTRPSHRADQIQVRQLLDKLLAARAVDFVAEEARPDLEALGLQAPEYELTLGAGSTSQKLQIGRSPTNDPSRVYGRLMLHTNIVLLPRELVDLLATPYSELRDRQLVAFAPELVDAVEVQGAESFTVRKNTSGQWVAGENPADTHFVEQWLGMLSQLEVSDFVKDVVTDFSAYGLATPQLQYTLFTAVTNSSGVTNLPVARLAFGTNAMNEAVYARRGDEDSVYAIRLLDYTRMPAAAWQFRNHDVWTFSTNQVARIIVQQGENMREVLRQANGDWVSVRGFNNDVNPFALEEIAFRLGDLNSIAWVGRGEEARRHFGFTANSPRLTVELRGEKPQALTVEFGGLSPLRLPYAATVMDGQPVVFEFPWPLYVDLQRYFNLAPPEGAALPRRAP